MMFSEKLFGREFVQKFMLYIVNCPYLFERFKEGKYHIFNTFRIFAVYEDMVFMN